MSESFFVVPFPGAEGTLKNEDMICPNDASFDEAQLDPEKAATWSKEFLGYMQQVEAPNLPEDISTPSVEFSDKNSFVKNCILHGCFPNLMDDTIETLVIEEMEEEKNETEMLFTEEDRSKKQVNQKINSLRDLLEAHQNSEMMSLKVLKRIRQILYHLQQNKLTHHLPEEMLLELVPLLDSIVQSSCGIDLFSTAGVDKIGMDSDQIWLDSGAIDGLIEQLFMGIECCLSLLTIMSIQGVDRRLVAEETIENVFGFFKNLVDKNTIPNFVVVKHASLKPTNRSIIKNSHNTREMSQKTMQLSSGLCDLMQFLCIFLGSGVRLQDRYLLVLSNVTLSFYSVVNTNEFLHGNDVNVLQMAALPLISLVFQLYEQHRNLILQDIFQMWSSLSLHKRHLRHFRISQSSSVCIQMLSALSVTLIQSCCIANSIPSSTKDADVTKTSGETQTDDDIICEQRVEKCRESARFLLSFFLKKISHSSNSVLDDDGALDKSSSSSSEFDYRILLTNFVEDLLVMIVIPEWPGAEILLDVLSQSLASVLNSNLNNSNDKMDSHYSLFAIDCLGKICASVRNYIVLNNRHIKCLTTQEDGTNIGKLTNLFPIWSSFSLSTSPSATSNTESNSISLKIQNWIKLYADQYPEYAKSSPELLLYLIVIDHLTQLSSCSVGVLEYHIPIELTRLQMQLCCVRNKVGKDLASLLQQSFDGNGVGKKLLRMTTTDEQEILGELNRFLMLNRCVMGVKFDAFLSHLMAFLTRSGSSQQRSLRARVLKNLHLIVDNDRTLMAQSQVQHWVCLCCTDESISVRHAAIELIGTYLLLQPQLLSQYYQMLMERLCDVGVSVRKSVIKLLHELLVQISCSADVTNEYTGSILRKMIERLQILTEESSIKELILTTLKDVWFFSTPRHTNNNPTATDYPQLTPHSILMTEKEATANNNVAIERWVAYSILEVIYEAGGKTDWFADLLRPLLQDSKTCNNTNGSNRKKQLNLLTKQRNQAEVRAKKVVGQLVEFLIQVEQGEALNNEEDDSKEGKQESPIFFLKLPVANQCVALLQAVYGFGCACPKLLVAYFETLTGYLLNNSTANQTISQRQIANQMVRYIAQLFVLIVPYVPNPPVALLSRLETRFVALLYQAPPSVLRPILEALYLLCCREKDYERSNPTIKVKEVLWKFYMYLVNFEKKFMLPSINEHEQSKKQLMQQLITSNVGSSLQRALFSIGLIVELIPMQPTDEQVGVHNKSQFFPSGNIKQDVYEIYKKYLSFFGDFHLKHLPKARRKKIKEEKINILAAATNDPPDLAIEEDMKIEEMRRHDIWVKGVAGFGFFFKKNPLYLLRTQQDGLFDDFLLADLMPICVQQHAIGNFTSLLQAEEIRLANLASQSSKKNKSTHKQVEGDQESEASLISGVMQIQLKNILKLTMSRNRQQSNSAEEVASHSTLRVECLSCLSLVLTQGLVSPMLCLTTLLALQTEQQVSQIRELSYELIYSIHEKYPSLLYGQLVPGIQLSHRFQTRAFGHVQVSVKDDDESSSYFAQVYTNCIRKSKGKRQLFLKELIYLFQESGAVLQAGSTMKKKSSKLSTKLFQQLDFLCYVTQILAMLPYVIESEPLTLIYLINRYSSLQVSSLLNGLSQSFLQLNIGLEVLGENVSEKEVASIDIMQYVDIVESTPNKNKILAALHQQCAVAFALGLLLRLKQYLKRRYMLDNEKCQTFQMNSTNGDSSRKNGEVACSVRRMLGSTHASGISSNGDSRICLKLPTHEDLSFNNCLIVSCWKQFMYFWSASHDDQHEVDFNVASTNTSRKRRRRSSAGNTKTNSLSSKKRKRKKIVEEDEEVEFIEGF